jgi:hypothetical protein
MDKKQRPIDLLRAANQNKRKYVRFDIPLGPDNAIEAIMNAPDVFLTLEEQEKIYQKKYAECVREGLKDDPINETDWEKDFEETIRVQREAAKKSDKEFNEQDARERALKDKPLNLAQQVAQKISRLRTVQEIIPKVIKTSDGKTLMFPTAEERAEFKEMICSDMKLFTYLSEKYIELLTDITKKENEVKNSSAEASLESG